ncbi:MULTISPECIES: ABC transporter permease [unclassified Acidisoma]|jgi:ribose transport system permease protein|uniref:ABC transporter permease n=1 Tax=unclassified Acidisoma TaxID=2634065 RepID=UPI00131D0E9D|nr:MULTISPECIES: ABC transporter permease [unclassified Acidisoma]
MGPRPSGAARQGAFGATVTFIVLFVVDFLLKGGHFSAFDLKTLCMNALPLVLVALGQFFVVLTNGIDLSLGPMMSVSGAIAALTFSTSPIGAVLLAMVAAAGGGLANAILVVRLRLPPILATLATMSIFQGVALVILPSPGGTVPAGLTAFLTNGGPALLPVPLVLLVCAALATGWTMTTRFGIWLRAVGGDEGAARSSGVAVSAVKFGAYVLAALLAGLGGLYLAIATANGSPTIGDSFILLSIAAVVLGRVAIVGGRGSPLGVVMGALTLTIIGSLLYFANLSSFYQSLINGLILVGVVGFDMIRKRFLLAVRGGRQ